MNQNALQAEPTPAQHINERYRRIETPLQKNARDLVAFWNARPADGIEIGRDIPSRRMARLLSHVLIWEPLPDGGNLRVHLAGEALRVRFGGQAVGRLFDEVVAPEVAPYFMSMLPSLIAGDICACFDMHLTRDVPVDGRKDLHFELVIFPVWAPHRASRWVLNGLFYF